VWVLGQAVIPELSTHLKNASWQCFSSCQRCLFFTQRFISFNLHWFRFPLVTAWIFSYLSLAAFWNHGKKAPHFYSSCSSFQYQEKQTIYPRWGFQRESQPLPPNFNNRRDENWESDDKLLWRPFRNTMGKQPSMDFIQSALQKRVPAIYINCNISTTLTSWVSGGVYCHAGGRWKQASITSTKEGIWLSVWMIESVSWCKSVFKEGFNWSQRAIGGIQRCKSGAIWALCPRRDRPHYRHRIQCPNNPSKHSSDDHGTCETYSFQFCDVCEYLFNEYGEDGSDSLCAIWGHRQDCFRPENLSPATCVHFRGKWIISTIVFIADIVH